MKTFGNLGSPSISPSVNLSHFFPSFFPFASKPPVSGNKRPLTGDDPPNFAIVLSFSFSLSPVPNCMPFNAQFHRQNTRKVSARKGSNYIVDQPSEDCQRIDNSFGWKEGRKPNSGATGSSTLTPRSRVEGIFNIDQDSLFPTSRFCAIARDTTSKHPRSSARRMATRHISLGSTSRIREKYIRQCPLRSRSSTRFPFLPLRDPFCFSHPLRKDMENCPPSRSNRNARSENNARGWQRWWWWSSSVNKYDSELYYARRSPSRGCHASWDSDTRAYFNGNKPATNH